MPAEGDRPKVLLVSQPTITGVGQCVLDWSVGLAALGWEAEVACPADGWLGQRCAEAGLTTHVWPSVREPQRAVLAELRRLREIVERVEPDVVYLHSSKAGMIGRMLLRGQTPTAFSPHSWSFEAAGGATARAALTWEQQAARWTGALICVSQAECDVGLSHGIRGSYTVARNGVDTSVITPLPTNLRAKARARLGIAAGMSLVVCVGRLQRQKGQDVLLAAWRELAPDGASLHLVGGGPDEATVRSAAEGTGAVLVGDVDRQTALQWLAVADLVVVPSRWEGMALVPLESLAVGSPVIASDVAGVREALVPSCGQVVPPEDPAALAAAIAQWLAKPAAELAEARAAARERATTQFDLSRSVATIDATLRGLLPPRGPLGGSAAPG